MCRLSYNLGASTSWNPQGLSRPVMGLLCPYLYVQIYTSSCARIPESLSALLKNRKSHTRKAFSQFHKWFISTTFSGMKTFNSIGNKREDTIMLLQYFPGEAAVLQPVLTAPWTLIPLQRWNTRSVNWFPNETPNIKRYENKKKPSNYSFWFFFTKLYIRYLAPRACTPNPGIRVTRIEIATK
jgi:hypothetical protein